MGNCTPKKKRSYVIPTPTKRSHWTYQPTGAKTVPLKIHCPRSPALQGNFFNGNCHDMRPTLWKHDACGYTDYIDGRGYIHCKCRQPPRCIFDAGFQCGSDNEYYAFSSYFDVVRANSTVMISMTGSGLAAAERAEFSQWVVGMN